MHIPLHRVGHIASLPHKPPIRVRPAMLVSSIPLPYLTRVFRAEPILNPRLSGLTLIFVEIPLLLRICPTSPTFDNFIRRFTTNYMRAAIYGVMSLIQWFSLIYPHERPTSLIAAAVMLLLAAICYFIAGLKGQGFVGSKTLGGQGVAQMIV